ncbi:hypothetical protein Sjap_009683 [Stephania japonica]|uniref:Fe2OG dioxygenase domain-containing protein n=1 Tax=Stephania japonica TaxID=461633 RepID=A0AAP0JA87_9MAGN
MSLKTGDNSTNLIPILFKRVCEDCEVFLQNRLQNLYLNSTVDGKLEITWFDSDNQTGVTERGELLSVDEVENCVPVEVVSEEIDGDFVIDEVENCESEHLFVNDGDDFNDDDDDGEFEEISLKDIDEEAVRVSGVVEDKERSDNLMGEGSLGLMGEESEQARFLRVGRKKDFVHYEQFGWKKTNVLQGLELHTGVFNAEEQNKIVNYVYDLQRMGQAGKLRERTYSEPRKWMRGKGRVTIQLGCCYNYAVDKDGNPPGILREEDVDPLPSLFKSMIKRLVRWHVLPPTCIPNSCIVNIYDEGDCIPPHIDHHDFLRPFCTVSFLTECNILFGSSLKIAGPGEFSGPVKVALPVGSVLILNGNGADVAKHCVPAVPAKRISITFRKMDESKLPYKFQPDLELQGIQPIAKSLSLSKPSATPVVKEAASSAKQAVNQEATKEPVVSLFNFEDDFPALGSGMKPKPKRR